MPQASIPDTFEVDFKNPDDIRTKLEEAKGIAREIRAQLDALRDLEKEFGRWMALATFLETQLPQNETPVSAQNERDAVPARFLPAGGLSNAEGSVVDLAVEFVNREVRKIRARDVWQGLRAEGHDLGRVQVSNALHYAAHKTKKIKAAEGRGMYAPRHFREPEPQPPLGPVEAPVS